MFGISIPFIGEIVSCITSVISVVVKTIGTAILDFAKMLEVLLKALGILEEDKDVEEIADKAIQAEEAGIKPEDFDTYDQYLKKIEDFEVDENRSKEISATDKGKKAVELLTGVVAENFGTEMATALILTTVANMDYFKRGNRMRTLGELTRDGDITINDVVDYIAKKPQSTERQDGAYDILLEVESKENPEDKIEDAMQAILDLRDNKTESLD